MSGFAISLAGFLVVMVGGKKSGAALAIGLVMMVFGAGVIMLSMPR